MPTSLHSYDEVRDIMAHFRVCEMNENHTLMQKWNSVVGKKRIERYWREWSWCMER